MKSGLSGVNVCSSQAQCRKNAAEKNPESCASKRAQKNSRASRVFWLGKAANGHLRRAVLEPGLEVRDGRERPGSKNAERQRENLPASVAQTQGKNEDEMILEPRMKG